MPRLQVPASCVPDKWVGCRDGVHLAILAWQTNAALACTDRNFLTATMSQKKNPIFLSATNQPLVEHFLHPKNTFIVRLSPWGSSLTLLVIGSRLEEESPTMVAGVEEHKGARNFLEEVGREWRAGPEDVLATGLGWCEEFRFKLRVSPRVSDRSSGER